jgi:dipeptidyl aminopeptidase/acylaminoacyl peptidase
MSDGIVFVRAEQGDTDPWQARLRDGAERRLLRTPARSETWPYWSAARGVLVLQLPPQPGRGPGLALLVPGASRETPLPGAAEPVQNWPVWSPDGLRLAYAFRTLEGGGIAAVDPGGAHEVWGRGRLIRPTFSPDGRRLLAQRLDGEGSLLLLLEPGRKPRPLLPPGHYDDKGRFTRDGRFVVFQRGAPHAGPRDLLRVPSEGGEAELFASLPEADDQGAEPSPTRDEVAFVSDRDGSPDLFLADLAGGAPRNLSRTPDAVEAAPHWSPDGERIALTLDAGGGSAASRVRVVDREGHVLFEAPGMMPSWMPPWR